MLFLSRKKYTAYNSFMEQTNFWEFQLTASINKAKAIEYVKNKLKPLIKAQKGVVTTIYSNKEIRLLIGVLEAQKVLIKQPLISAITEIICTEYKCEYIKQNLNFSITNDLLFKSFLKGLVCFDSDIEKQIVYSKLIEFDNIVLESFFDFRLKFLKEKWQDLILLANDNYLYLLSGGNFFELMKFLLSNLDCKAEKIEVSFENDSFKVLSNGKELQLPHQTSSSSQEDLVTFLVSLSPKNITIYDGQFLSAEIKNFLCNLFENRIQIVK